MACRLLVNRIDHVERGLGEMSAGSFRIGPDGKEFRAQVAGAGFVQADVADVLGVGVADIEVLVKKALRRVGVRINDDGGVVNGARPGSNGLCGQGCGQQQEEGRPENIHGFRGLCDKGFYTVERLGVRAFMHPNSLVPEKHRTIGRRHSVFSDTQREIAVAIFRGERRTDSATSQLRNPGITMVLPLSNPW